MNKTINKYYKNLSDYFSAQPLLLDIKESKQNVRKVIELPWLYFRLNNWKDLNKIMSNISFFSIAWDIDRFSILRYWSVLESKSSYRKMESYKGVLKSLSSYSLDDLWKLTNFCSISGLTTFSLPIVEFLVDKYKKNDDRWKYSSMINQLGKIYYAEGNLDNSLKYFKEFEKISREEEDAVGIAGALINQSLILTDIGDYSKGLSTAKKAEEISRKIGFFNGMYQSLINQGINFQKIGQSDKALTIYREAESICRKKHDNIILQTILGNQATIYIDTKKYELALKLLKNKEKICFDLGMQKDYLESQINIANILSWQGSNEEAMNLYNIVEVESQKLNWKEGTATVLFNKAETFRKWGQFDNALDLFNKTGVLFKEMGKKEELQKVYGYQSSIFLLMHKFKDSNYYSQKQELVCRELNNYIDLIKCLLIQAVNNSKLEKNEKALTLAKEARNIANTNNISSLREKIDETIEIIEDQLYFENEDINNSGAPNTISALNSSTTNTSANHKISLVDFNSPQNIDSLLSTIDELKKYPQTNSVINTMGICYLRLKLYGKANKCFWKITKREDSGWKENAKTEYKRNLLVSTLLLKDIKTYKSLIEDMSITEIRDKGVQTIIQTFKSWEESINKEVSQVSIFRRSKLRNKLIRNKPITFDFEIGELDT